MSEPATGVKGTFVVDADEKSFVLAPVEEDELAERIAEADRGELVLSAELLSRLALKP